MTVLFVVMLVLFTVHKLRRRRRRRLIAERPLSGMDTGTRSPWRAPAKTRFHRGF